jgi:hypothetical protein
MWLADSPEPAGQSAGTWRSWRGTSMRTSQRHQERAGLLPQPACGSAALIAHWAAKARSYAGRASPRAT